MPVGINLLEADHQVLVRQCQQNLEAASAQTAEDLARSIAWRIYTEWCCGEGRGSAHCPYNGEAFQKWVDDEAYLEHERRSTAAAPENPDAQYRQVREEIIGAVVRRATELFRAWGGQLSPSDREGDHRNLRASLSGYLQKS